MRRLSTAIAAAVLLMTGLIATAANAGARSASSEVRVTPAVPVVKISGQLDPILADFLEQTVRNADADHAPAIVLRVNSSGSVISDQRLRSLARVLHDAHMPVIAWLGPADVHAQGAIAQLLAVVDSIGIAPGGQIGNMGQPVVPVAMWSPAFREHRAELEHNLFDADEAARAGLTVPTNDALVLRRMLLAVPGFHATKTSEHSATPIEFAQLSTGSNLMHSFASPAVAQLLFIIGLCLILFELYSAGIGVAGLTGALFLVLGCYGLGVLPIRPIAVALLVVSMVAYAVDVQVGTPRFWTAAASVLFAVGMLGLYQGVATPWPSTIAGIVGVILFMVYAMPAVVRSRFSTPVIDRKWLVGNDATVVSELGPDGTIRIGEGTWAARARSGSISPGRTVRVISVEGVLCQVDQIGS